MVCKFHNIICCCWLAILSLWVILLAASRSSPSTLVLCCCGHALSLILNFGVLNAVFHIGFFYLSLLCLLYIFFHFFFFCLGSVASVSAGSVCVFSLCMALLFFVFFWWGLIYLYMKRDFFTELCINRCVLASDIISLISTRA